MPTLSLSAVSLKTLATFLTTSLSCVVPVPPPNNPTSSFPECPNYGNFCPSPSAKSFLPLVWYSPFFQVVLEKPRLFRGIGKLSFSPFVWLGRLVELFSFLAFWYTLVEGAGFCSPLPQMRDFDPSFSFSPSPELKLRVRQLVAPPLCHTSPTKPRVRFPQPFFCSPGT